MKTQKPLLVNFLRIYPVERDVTSVNGVKGKRAGALVLRENLPSSSGQKVSNAVELSAKQLDNLASMHGIRATGKKGWSQFATLIGVGKSACIVSSEEHAKGDKYVDTLTGEEKEYSQTSTNNSIDSIVLPDRVTAKMIDKTIEDIINFNEEDSILTALESEIAEPVASGAK